MSASTALAKLQAAPPGERVDLVVRRARAAARTWWLRRRHPRVTFGRGVQVRGTFKVSGPGRVWIGEGTRIDGLDVQTHTPEATVHIGARCYVNFPQLRARQSIVIGDECILGSALVLDSDLHPVGPNRHDPTEAIATAPVVLGRNVWLAARTAVLKGVTIGDDAVVALGSVVRRDVPSGVVVAPPEPEVVRTLVG